MTAIEQLERLLYILPAAARQDGIALAELARALHVDRRTVLADLEQATARAYYHPAATVDPFTILIEDDSVQVHSAGEFDRPVRLNARELLALGLGLRALAAEADEPRRAEILVFAERLEDELSGPELVLQPRLARDVVSELGVPLAVEQDEPIEVELGEDDFRGLVASAIEHRRACVLEYLKAGEAASEERRVLPQQLMYANGRWYVAAYDLERSATRVFRLDRVLNVDVLLDSSEVAAVPALGDPSTQRQQVFEADQEAEAEVTVRYAPRIARWIAERAPVETLPDGSVRVRHQVADPRWLVRHVLQYGGDAVVEGAEPYRSMVAQAARRLSA